MKKSSLLDNLVYKEGKPAISVLFESDFSKEIRIVFSAGQTMKEHKTNFPISVELFDGELDFGVNGEVHRLSKGDIVALGPNIPHDLNAITNCIVRLSLSKKDTVQRVIGVTK